MKRIKADEVFKKKVTKSGNSAHIPIAKRFLGKFAWVLFENTGEEVRVSGNPRIPKKVHKGFDKEQDRLKKEWKELGEDEGYWKKKN